jgi:hypothetical protein
MSNERNVVHNEVMDTLQDIAKILDITKTHTLPFKTKKSCNRKKKIPEKQPFSCIFIQKTSNIMENLTKGQFIFTVSLLLKMLFKKKYFTGESHQIWYFNCIHTAILIIKNIASFSSKNYVSSVKVCWTCICLLVPFN